LRLGSAFSLRAPSCKAAGSSLKLVEVLDRPHGSSPFLFIPGLNPDVPSFFQRQAEIQGSRTFESSEIAEKLGEFTFAIQLLSAGRSRSFNQASEVPANAHPGFRLDGILRDGPD
jgi:hypothetical protein